MTRSEHIRALQEEYAQQRARNEAELNRRVAEACAARPEIAQLRAESSRLAFESLRRILGQNTQAQRRAIAEDMKKRGQAVNARIDALLAEAGLPADALRLRFRCPVCQDTGYVGEAPARFCECFEKRLRQRLFEDGSMAGLDTQNFEHFDESVFPEADGQRAMMLKVRDFCERYADSFPDIRPRNLLLMGEGGLGKTFLLNCVCERVSSRGFSAVRVTGFRLFEAMRQQHFGQGDGDQGYDALIEAPLLLIDDLGTEPMMRNITVEYLFTLLNERINARRHTVIATNLTPVQIKNRYGERVASRLLDKTVCGAIQLRGKDLRSL